MGDVPLHPDLQVYQPESMEKELLSTYDLFQHSSLPTKYKMYAYVILACTCCKL